MDTLLCICTSEINRFSYTIGVPFFYLFSFISMRAVCNAENNYGDKLIKTNAGRIPCSPGSAAAFAGKISIDIVRRQKERAFDIRISDANSRRASARRLPKNNFQLPCARDDPLRRGPAMPFSFFIGHPRRCPVAPQGYSQPPPPQPRTATTVREHHPAGCAARRAGRFCFPLFSGFSGWAAPDTARQQRWRRPVVCGATSSRL